MPIPQDYPEQLPAPLLGKKRMEQQKFDSRNNFDGKLLTRKLRNNSTVYFEVNFLIPRSKLPLMAMWLTKVDLSQEFKMKLRSEGGTNEYNCRWSEVPINPDDQDGYYRYTGVIYAPKLLQGWEGQTPQQLDDLYDLLADGGYDPLDRAVNDIWPSL